MRGWMGMGTILKLVVGIGVGMGIRVPGTAVDGYKYLSPCSSLTVRSHNIRLHTSLFCHEGSGIHTTTKVK